MEANKKIKDIHERIYQFVIRVLRLLSQLPRIPVNLMLINQIARSVTSMGANDQEADGTTSKKDFIAKYTIVRKEGKETRYWLRLIADTNSSYKTRMEGLIQEAEEIIKIVSSIIYKTKTRE